MFALEVSVHSQVVCIVFLRIQKLQGTGEGIDARNWSDHMEEHLKKRIHFCFLNGFGHPSGVGMAYLEVWQCGFKK